LGPIAILTHYNATLYCCGILVRYFTTIIIWGRSTPVGGASGGYCWKPKHCDYY
jgi:hypothetical protein